MFAQTPSPQEILDTIPSPRPPGPADDADEIARAVGARRHRERAGGLVGVERLGQHAARLDDGQGGHGLRLQGEGWERAGARLLQRARNLTGRDGMVEWCNIRAELAHGTARPRSPPTSGRGRALVDTSAASRWALLMMCSGTPPMKASPFSVIWWSNTLGEGRGSEGARAVGKPLTRDAAGHERTSAGHMHTAAATAGGSLRLAATTS
jgi:hypothetical protein